MIERYFGFLGEEDTLKLLEANEKPLIPSIRVNTLKISVNDLKERLENKDIILKPIDWIPYGFKILESKLNLGSTHEYLQGYYYLQNIASMLPAYILNPNKSDTVIDMCAAPGSKATQLAQIMNNQGNLILIEKNSKRIPALTMNIRRLGVMNSIVLNFDAIKLQDYRTMADKILLDAPCTGEGLIREDPSRKKSRTMNDINKMVKIQKMLLKSGLQSLNPGGELLYSTCSIAPEENELVVNDVLNEIQNVEVLKLPNDYGVNGIDEIYGLKLRKDLRFSQRLYPHIHNTIGFYFCLIKKRN